MPRELEGLHEREERALWMGRCADGPEHRHAVGAGVDAGGGSAGVDPAQGDDRRAMASEGGDPQRTPRIALGGGRIDGRPGRVVDTVVDREGADVAVVTRVRRDAQAGLRGHRSPRRAYIDAVGQMAAIQIAGLDESGAAMHQDAGPARPDERLDGSTSRGQGVVVEVFGADDDGDVGRDAEGLKGDGESGEGAAAARTTGVVIGEEQKARRRHILDRAC